MAKIEREIPNPLGLEAAKPKVAALIEKLKTNYSSIVGDVKWNDDQTAADVSGKGFSGNFALTEKSIKVAIELGFAASLFKGKVESELDSHLKDLTSEKA